MGALKHPAMFPKELGHDVLAVFNFAGVHSQQKENMEDATESAPLDAIRAGSPSVMVTVALFGVPTV